MEKEIKYPATCVVHWATGPVPCCAKHGNALKALGNMLGSHIAVTMSNGIEECKNCVNEADSLTINSNK